MIKQTQSQFYGKSEDLPVKMISGSQYVSTDFNEIYIYGEDEKPYRISIDANSLVTPQNVTISQMNNLTPKLGEIVFETDTNVNRYWNGVEWKIFPTGSTPIDDVLDNRIIVNQTNVATTLGGVIDSTKEYFLDGIIDLGTTQITVPSTGMSIRGYSFDLSGMISSENNYTMFISASIGGDGNGSGNLLGMDYLVSVTGAGSKVYELYDDTGFNAFEFSRVNFIECTSLGDIYDYRQGLELGTGRFGGSPSLTLHGLWRGGYRITTSIVRSLAGIMTAPLFKEGTLFQMNSRFLTDMNVDLPTLAPFTDIDSARFPNTSTIQFQNMEVTRDGAYNSEDANLTPNMSAGDLACYWKGNNGIPNTYVGATASIIVETVTPIAVQGDYYPILGTFLETNVQHFEVVANGGMKHLGNNPRDFNLSLNLNIDGNPNVELAIKAFKWDDSEGTESPLEYTIQRRVVNNFQGGRDVAFFIVSTGTTLDQNDIVYWRVANDTSTSNVTAENLSFIRIEER